MADKEERILHIVQKLDGRFVGEKRISRQEAIERMAKGLFKVDNLLALDIKWSQLKKSKQLVYKEFAEAALNALLEGHK